MEISVLTTDQTFVEGLNAAGIQGVRAEYRPTMAYDSTEHICEIVIVAIGTVGLHLVADWIVARWNKEKPKQMDLNKVTINNADQIVTVINNYIESQSTNNVTRHAEAEPGTSHK